MEPGDEYEYELTGDRAEIATLLTGVVDGVAAGAVRLDDGATPIAVALPEELDLEVELERDPDEMSLEIELEWDPDATGADVEIADTTATDTDGETTAVNTGEEAGTADADEGETVEKRDAPEPAAAEDTPLEGDALEVTPVTDDETTTGALAGGASQAQFEVYRDRGGEWRWRLRHRNGNVIATSGEGYTRRRDAENGLRSVMRNAPGAPITDEADAE